MLFVIAQRIPFGMLRLERVFERLLAIWSLWKTWTTALLAKGMFGKHMLDAAFGQFRTIVKQVCWKRGKFFAEVDARGTSQQCPECGGEVKKDLKLRVHDCPHCSYRTDRDVAAGQVIRNRGIKLISTVGQTGKETACAADLPGAGDNSTPRQVAKARKRKTRKTKL
jgi:putative transposase